MLTLKSYSRKKEMSIIVKSLKLAIPLFLLFVTFCFSQSAIATQGAKPKPDSPTPAPTVKSQPKAEADEVALPADPNAIFPAVIARVNGKPVLGRELEVFVRRELASIGNPEWKDLREDYRGQLTLSGITSLINSKLLYQKAIAAGIKATDAEVQTEVDKIAKSYKSDAEMNEALAAQLLDRESLQQNLAQSLSISKYIDSTVSKSVAVTPDEVAKYYAAHPSEFSHPDIVRTSHILIRGGATSELDTMSKQRAEALLARVKKGEDFAKLAKEHSMDASASKGGDLGFATKDSMGPELGDAAFSMAVGDVRLVKTQYGYHVFKVTDRKKEGVAPLEEVRAELTELMKNNKAQEELTKLVNQLRDQAKIEVLIPYGQPLNP